MRKDERSQKMVPHGFFPADVMEEHILKEFGGGHYRVQLLVPDEMGREQIKRSRDIHLPGAYKPPTGDLPGIGARDATRAAPSSAPSAATVGTVPPVSDIMSAGILQLFQASATQQQMMMQMFSSAQQAQAALLQHIAGNRGPDFPSLLAAITPLVTEFLKRPKEERDPLEMLRAVGEIVKQNTGGRSEMAETLGALRDLMDLKNDLAPEPRGGTGDPLLDSLPKLAEIMWEGWQEQKQARVAVNGQRPAARLAPPAPVVAPVPAGDTAANIEPQPEPLPTNMPLYKVVLRREGPRLIQQAAAGRNAAVVAGMAVEFAPQNVKGAIAEFFHQDTETVCKELVEEIPELAQFPNWVVEFVQEVQDLMFPGEYDVDDGGGDDAEEHK